MLLSLFLGFLKVGLFSYGGAYGAIPLIREVVLTNGWLDDTMITTMIAISESTPGPIMVNLATYIGSSQAGLLGALTATFGVVLPSFLIILFILRLMKSAVKSPYVQAILRGMKPCVVGIVLSTGVTMILKSTILENQSFALRLKPLLATLLLAFLYFGSRKIPEKKLSPYALIILSALLGILIG